MVNKPTEKQTHNKINILFIIITKTKKRTYLTRKSRSMKLRKKENWPKDAKATLPLIIFNTSWHEILKFNIKRINKGKLHHEIQTSRNSDKNEDPLNEKKSLDKALMTGQQKEERTCTLQDHRIINKKEKGITHTKNRFQEPPKRTKTFKKGLYPHEDHIMDKGKCQSRLMTCQNPFKREKDTEERRKTIKNLLRAL